MNLIKQALFQGFVSGNINVSTVLVCFSFTIAIGIYIFIVYRLINRNTFYNKNFNLSLIAMTIITSAIILTIQSNIVVSLGMVGALSIVRFRTAIKDPMDLVFLFWAISVGIICGAGFGFIAVLASIGITIVILIFRLIPESIENQILVINASSYKYEEQLLNTICENSKLIKIRSRNVSKSNLNLAVEVRVNVPTKLIGSLIELPYVDSASLVEKDNELT